MQKRSNLIVNLSLLALIIYGLWHQVRAFAQDVLPGSSISQLALLAVAPPPGNAGVLDLYQLPGVPDFPKVNVAIPGYPLSAVWSPDGNILAFIMISGQPGNDAPPSDFDIYTIDRQGTGLVKLTDTPNCPEIGLAWQADSSALYFSGFCRDSQATTFWRLDPRTTAAEHLGEVQWDGTWAVWSPDVSKIALLAPRKAEDGAVYNELVVVSPDGQSVTAVANDLHPGYQLQQSTVLAWSPLGDWLAFASRTEGTGQGDVNQIILVRPDGSERKVLAASQPGQECLNPLWSLDGQRVAFTCGGSLFSVQSDGADLRNLTSPSAGQAVEYPAWSPGGESLAFISLASDGTRHLESVQADGTQRQQLADILAVQTFGLVWNPIAQEMSQVIIPTPTSLDVSQANSLTPDGSAASPVLNLTPESLSGQGEGLTSGSPAGPADASPPTGQVGNANNLSYVWLLLFLVVGGGGIFLLMRRSEGLSDLAKREEERKLRRERRLRERSSGPQMDDRLASTPAETARSMAVSTEGAVEQVKGHAGAPEPSVLLQQGISQVRSKDIQGGIVSLRQYIEIVPGDSTAWLWLGWASALDNEFRTAERCFLHARRLGNPQAGEALDWLHKSRQ